VKFPPLLPQARPFDVVGLGGNAWDRTIMVPHHPVRGQKLRFDKCTSQGGGRAATAMVTLARLGMRVRYLGGIGDDPEGRESIESLRSEGIDVTGVRVRPGGLTQRAFILVDEDSGERTIVWGRSDEMMLRREEIDEDSICSGKLLHTDAQEPDAAHRAASAARRAAMPVLADLESVRPGLDAFLPLVDVLITSEDFPEAATGASDLQESSRILEARSEGALIIVTLGGRGAVARIDGRLHHFPAYAIDPVDTNGAGDVFHGAFAAACIAGFDLAAAIDFSNAVAAMKCRQLGGRTGIPHGFDEVDRFRRQTPRREGGGIRRG
jgi:sulfofructose kinase